MKSTDTFQVDGSHADVKIHDMHNKKRSGGLRKNRNAGNKKYMNQLLLIILLSAITLVQTLYFIGCHSSYRIPIVEESVAVRTEGKGMEKANSILFQTDYHMAMETAVRDTKPLLLFFTLANCPSSQKMQETTFQDPEIIRLSERFVCVALDAIAYPDQCKSYDVKGFPTILLMNSQGTELCRFSGTQTAEQLSLQMHVAIQTTASKIGSVIRK